MNNTPKKLRDKWSLEGKKICARANEGGCGGRLTKEHTIIFKGKQLQEDWAIIDLCERHHAVLNYQDNGDLQKEKNVWIALNRASDEELEAISKVIDFKRKRDYLNKKYGTYPRH